MASIPIAEHENDFAYGSLVAVSSSIVVAMGIGLQKTAHRRMLKKPEEEREAVVYQPVWVLGLLLMLCGEVGNLLSYGDRLTPTSAIVSIGCLGVVANLVIATTLFKEELSLYDIVGLVFSVAGVIFVIFFAPNNPEQLSSERLNKLLIGWGAITIYIVYGLLIVLLLFVVKKKGHTTVLYYTLLSSLIGSFTVMASKPVATFIILGIEGAASDHLYTELKVSFSSEAECEASNGFGVGTQWRAVTGGDMLLLNATHGCYYEGLGQFDQPAFWCSLVVLVVTAILQLKYLNDALSLFSISSVIPIQYVFFTTFSCVGAIVVYQEYSMLTYEGCTQWWTLHLFLDGIFGTFLGVYFITTRKVTIDMDDPESIRTALLELQEAGAVAGGITMSVDAQIGVLEPLLKPEVASPEVVEIVFGGKPPPLSSPPPAHGANPPLLKPSMERGGSALIGLSRGSSRNFMGSGSGSTLRQSQGSQGSQRSASNLSHGGLGGIASAASSTRESRESAASEAPLRASRASFAERAEDVAESFGETVKSILPKGFDSVTPNRASRASNAISFFGALSGGQQAMFMYDPADKRTRDEQAAMRAAADRKSVV